MAPEAPGNLVVIDLRFQNGALKGYAECVEYHPEKAQQIEAMGGWFYVLWNETPKGEGFIPIGGGVVYVKGLPSGYEISSKSPIEPDSLGEDQYAYRYPALGEGLMFVLILPEGYTLANFRPIPKSVKVFRKRRLAVYWKPEGKYGAEVKITWRIRRFDGNLRSESNRLNTDVEKSEVPDNAGVIVDELPRWGEGESSSIHNPWISGSFYLAAFAVITALLLVAANTIPLWALPVIIVGALLALSVVGAFQLKQDGRLTQKNFLELMVSIFRQLPVLTRRVLKSSGKSASRRA